MQFLLAIGCAVTIGILIPISANISDRYYWIIIMAPVSIMPVMVLYGIILKRWQKGIYALLIYMPFSGLPGILLYPIIATGWMTLIKDIFFIIPAYLGFIWWYSRTQKRLIFSGGMITIIGMFFLVVLVILQCFNPNIPNPMVALIGLKVWLFYLPLFLLGYHLVNTKAHLVKLAQTILAFGIIPALYGIAQAILIYTGNRDIAYAFHGLAAEGATQMFASFEVASGAWLMRVPSLFTFPLQYSSFLLVLLSVAYGLWYGGIPKQTHRIWYFTTLAMIVVALFTSGVRAVYTLVPAFFVITLLLERKWRKIWKTLIALISLVPVGLSILVWLLGSTLRDFLNFTNDVIMLYLGTESEFGLIHQFEYAMDITWLGMGTGMNTGPARYAFWETGGKFTQSSYVNIVFDTMIESFQGKVIIELGIIGAIIVVFLLACLIITGYLKLRQVKDPTLRAIGIGLLAFIITTVIYLYKGAVLDYDPLNVCFWLFAGILMKIPEL